MYLMHHGREGMHWYIKNGPPYPLGQSNKEYKKTQSENLKDKRNGGFKYGSSKPDPNDFEHTPSKSRYFDGKKLTKAGEKRYMREVLDNAKKKKENRVKVEDLNDPDRWVRDDIESARNIANSSKDIVNELRNIERASGSSKKQKMGDYSHLTDQQLRDYINRANLERQYNDIVNPKTTSRGREITQKVLEYGGATLAMTASSLGIVLSIRKLMGK